ncbi:MAG: lamin tail domain-containing protein [Haloarculaceae archaeon]
MERVATVALVAAVVLAGCGGLAPDDRSPTGNATQQGLGRAYTVSVTAVVDGDTIHVRYRNGSTDTVRLLGVDTPETHVANAPDEFEGVPNTTAGRDCLREAGHEATRFTTERLLGETVTLRVDPLGDARGYYGRLLAYVFQDGRDLNYRLVATGHARVYDSEFARAERFYAAETRAQRNRTGLWTCAVDAPVPGNLTVERVRADPAGPDGDDLNGEYVVLANRGTEPIDLGGWTLSDAAGHTYEFPTGADLAPGDRLTLHTGSGTDGPAAFYWGARTPVWNNDGDTVVVRDATGRAVARYRYT